MKGGDVRVGVKPVPVVGVMEGQCMFVSPNVVRSNSVLFPNLKDSVAVIIYMKNRCMVCYYKKHGDGMNSFAKALKSFGVTGEKVSHIKIVSGSFRNAFFPKEGDNVICHVQSKDRTGAFVENRRGVDFIKHKNGKQSGYSGCTFYVNFPYYSVEINGIQNNSESFSGTDRDSYLQKAQDALKKLRLNASFVREFVRTRETYFFSVDSIEQCLCSKNQTEVVDALKNFLGDIDAVKNIEFKIVPCGSFVSVAKREISFSTNPKDITYCASVNLSAPNEDVYSSDPEENFDKPNGFSVHEMEGKEEVYPITVNAANELPYLFHVYSEGYPADVVKPGFIVVTRAQIANYKAKGGIDALKDALNAQGHGFVKRNFGLIESKEWEYDQTKTSLYTIDFKIPPFRMDITEPAKVVPPTGKKWNSGYEDALPDVSRGSKTGNGAKRVVWGPHENEEFYFFVEDFDKNLTTKFQNGKWCKVASVSEPEPDYSDDLDGSLSWSSGVSEFLDLGHSESSDILHSTDLHRGGFSDSDNDVAESLLLSDQEKSGSKQFGKLAVKGSAFDSEPEPKPDYSDDLDGLLSWSSGVSEFLNLGHSESSDILHSTDLHRGGFSDSDNDVAESLLLSDQEKSGSKQFGKLAVKGSAFDSEPEPKPDYSDDLDGLLSWSSGVSEFLNLGYVDLNDLRSEVPDRDDNYAPRSHDSEDSSTIGNSRIMFDDQAGFSNFKEHATDMYNSSVDKAKDCELLLKEENEAVPKGVQSEKLSDIPVSKKASKWFLVRSDKVNKTMEVSCPEFSKAGNTPVPVPRARIKTFNSASPEKDGSSNSTKGNEGADFASVDSRGFYAFKDLQKKSAGRRL